MRECMIGGRGMEDMVLIARPRMSGLRSLQSCKPQVSTSVRYSNWWVSQMALSWSADREEARDRAGDFFGA
jgi:hypothetical protein